MKNRNKEILNLIYKYGSDTRQALKENKKLPYLYALAELRENVLEWYDFKKEGRLLQVGADYGALTGLFLKKVSEVTVLDPSEESLNVVKMRYRGTEHLKLSCGTLAGAAGAEAAPASEAGAAENGTVEPAAPERLSGGFDYVTVIGTLTAEETLSRQLEAAKALLAPGGVLLLAVCNTFGIKYFAGAERDEITATKKELKNLLPGGRFFYPVPDYKIANEIYSDSYLPKKGDLTGALTVYDYPQYTSMEVGAAYDAVCEDGQFDNFTNSFLVIWEKGV